MTRTLRFEQFYPADPDRVFALVTDLDTLEAVTRPWIRFHHLPSGPVHEGQVIDMALQVFGFPPVRPYKMRIVQMDRAARRMATREEGAGLRSLAHRLEVRPVSGGACLIDEIEIDAGWLTPLAAVLAWLTYRWRHHVRLRLLAAG